MGHSEKYILQELKIEVIYQCPLVCIHCSSEAAPNISKEIEISQLESIIKEAHQLGLKKLAISGGEPFLYSQMGRVIALTNKLRIRTTIYTSGNVSNFQQQLDDLHKSGNFNLIFSLFSYDRSCHDLITRKNGSFERTLDSINTAVKRGIEVEIHFVALKRNFSHLRMVAILSKKLGVHKVSVLRFVPQGRGSLLDNDILQQKEYFELQEEIIKLRNEGFNIRTGSPFNFLKLNHEPACTSGIDRLIIDPELNIFPCDAFKQISSEQICGTSEYSNLSINTLSDCWVKSPYLKSVREILSSDFMEPCQSCNDLKFCLSGCLAQKVLFSGKLMKQIDPACINLK